METLSLLFDSPLAAHQRIVEMVERVVRQHLSLPDRAVFVSGENGDGLVFVYSGMIDTTELLHKIEKDVGVSGVEICVDNSQLHVFIPSAFARRRILLRRIRYYRNALICISGAAVYYLSSILYDRMSHFPTPLPPVE